MGDCSRSRRRATDHSPEMGINDDVRLGAVKAACNREKMKEEGTKEGREDTRSAVEGRKRRSVQEVLVWGSQRVVATTATAAPSIPSHTSQNRMKDPKRIFFHVGSLAYIMTSAFESPCPV